MPVVGTKAAASAQGFGEFTTVSGPANYIEDVFSTWLYTGTGSAQTITNGIDLAGKGGLVWIKKRNDSFQGQHILSDTVRGAAAWLSTNSTGAAGNDSNRISSFLTNGFSIGTEGTVNSNSNTFASWTFRKQPKFFDVVTWTGTGSAQTISHNLGSVPGCIIVKRTSGTQGWIVYHRSLTSDQYYLQLNLTDAQDNSGQSWAVTSTTFNANSNVGLNASGATYVAYLFAHDAGGFGLTGTDNVISCGSFTTDGSGNATVDLGYEPQWLLIKSSSSVNDWTVVDNMRGWVANGGYADLNPNLSAAEDNYLVETFLPLTATGFKAQFTSGNASKTYIYIAIRRGPMKTPTSGTSVFSPNAVTSSSSNTTVDAGFPIDLSILKIRNAVDSPSWFDRLRGITASSNPALRSPSTAAEVSTTDLQNAGQTTVQVGPIGTYNDILWNFRRAPGFFDVVCYTGDGTSNRTINHNLGVAPDMIIVKRRNTTAPWEVYVNNATLLSQNKYMELNYDTPASSSGQSRFGNGTNMVQPTSAVFTVGNSTDVNASGSTYVAYLFGSCAGVSKVGSYTGNNNTQDVNCGFTGGARFVMIKRIDDYGDWFVWDSARGISSSSDPYLRINSTAAEVTGTNYIDTNSAGFRIENGAPAAINANGGTFIYLAIA